MREVDRYTLLGELASGGMGSVHLGRLTGPGGFTRAVAIKRLHPVYAKLPEFVSMLLDEARLAARIRHPNVVATHDVIVTDDNVHLVMDYVEGESLARIVEHLARRDTRAPPAIASAIMSSALRGLHAAHEATSDSGEPLGIVHRDVSPQNIMVSVDGVVRVVDFGIAKAAGRLAETRDRQVKGKLRYMAPEQARGKPVSRQADVYAAGIVLWELLTGEPLHQGAPNAILERVLFGTVPPPSSRVDQSSPELDAIIAKATARSAAERYATAADMARAIEDCVRPALPAEVSAWLEEVAGEALRERAALVGELEKRARCEGTVLSGTEGAAAEQPARPPAAELAATGVVGALGPACPSRERGHAPVRTCTGASDRGALEMSTEVQPVRPRPLTRRIAATSIVALLVLAASVAIVYQPRRATEPSASAAVPAVAASGAARPSASSDLDPSAEPEPVAAPEPKSEPRVEGDGARIPKRRTPTQRGAERVPEATRADCSVPFTLDSGGRKIYRRECIGAAP